MRFKERFAVLLCIAAAAICGLLIERGYAPWKVLMGTAMTWGFIGSSLRGSQWKLINLTLPEIYAAAKRGELRIANPIARSIAICANALLIAAAVCWLQS
jgi:hypothetical protein